MNRPKIHVDSIAILETPRGWMNKRTGYTHKTAVGALRSIRRRGRERAASFGGAAVVITWETRTPVGLAIAKALQ